MSLLDMVQQGLGQPQVNQISQQLGVSPSSAQTAISAAVPMILGGMAQHASQPEGAGTVQEAIGAHRDVPDNIGSLIQAGAPADQTGLLGRILGRHQDTVQQGVQQASGLDSEKTRKLLLMLSPIVLGMLARHHFGAQGAQQPSQGQIADTLRQEAQTAQKQSPHVGGLLGKLLNAVEAPRT